MSPGTAVYADPKAVPSGAARTPVAFPIGYHSLHPNVSMNFQMNRWYGCVGEPEMLEEMRTVAPQISTYADWKREFVALAERASRNFARAGFRSGSSACIKNSAERQ